MSNDRLQPVEKSFGTRIVELMQSLQVLRDSIGAVHAGKGYQMIPIYSQMRALLTDKASQNKPLLFEIAKKLDEKLEFYAMPSPAGDTLHVEGKEKVLAHMSGFPVGLHQSLPLQELVTMKAFIDRPLYLLRDRTHTCRKIIQLFATKAGGSHYAGKVTREDAELLSPGFLGAAMLNSTLLQLAEVTLALGQRVLRRICKFDLHIILFAPTQQIEKPRTLVDSKYPTSRARFVIALHPAMKLAFHAVGIDGSRASLINERATAWPGTHYVWISTDLSDELHTTLRLMLDGDETATTTLPFPLFIPNTLTDFDTYVNRSQEDAAAGATFGLGELAAFGGEQSAIARARLLLYFDKSRKEASGVAYYKPGTYGHAPPGVNDLMMSPGVVLRSMESLRKEHGMN
jgi:hypothetical protein